MSKRTLPLALISFIAGALLVMRPWDGSSERNGGRNPSGSPSGSGNSKPIEWDLVTGREQAGRESIEDLRTRLLAMSPADAVDEIEGFLATGRDAATGQGFEIGSGGMMEACPTLRVFLLDLLLRIDPSAAARISRGILEKPTSADEWAISLRNVAKGEEGDANRDYLRGKAEDLILNPVWKADPSVGYLNAFDVLVHTRATESSPLLSGLIQDKDRRDLAHAAFLTLDRLVQRDPVAMLEKLAADRALQVSRPEMTAQQFARADLRDDRQRDLVKEWLLDPARTPTELRNFAGTFPNNNRMISNNLLTSEERVSGEDLRTHDREVLAIIRQWREDEAFKPIAEHLGTMDARLSQFVTGAGE